MLTIRKLAFLIGGIFLFVLFYVEESSSPHSSSLVRNNNPQRQSSSTGKTKDEIERILETANRPLRTADEFGTLREHLEYLFPYEGAAATKFPAYIWQTWKYTPAMGEFDERFRMTEASWTERHPDYIHEVQSNLPQLNLTISTFPDTLL
jgi:alpha 1,6-mannosyltransferase